MHGDLIGILNIFARIMDRKLGISKEKPFAIPTFKENQFEKLGIPKFLLVDRWLTQLTRFNCLTK